MRFVCLGLGGFLGRFFFSLEPFGVENAGLVNPLVRVRPEEIALGLQKIGG